MRGTIKNNKVEFRTPVTRSMSTKGLSKRGGELKRLNIKNDISDLSNNDKVKFEIDNNEAVITEVISKYKIVVTLVDLFDILKGDNLYYHFNELDMSDVYTDDNRYVFLYCLKFSLINTKHKVYTVNFQLNDLIELNKTDKFNIICDKYKDDSILLNCFIN